MKSFISVIIVSDLLKKNNIFKKIIYNIIYNNANICKKCYETKYLLSGG